MEDGKKKTTRNVLIAVAVVVVAAIAAFAWYVSVYYHADNVAIAAVADEDGGADGVTVRELPDGKIAFVPDQVKAGFIFYPGGKVQPESYAPLLTECARRGILCVLVKPTFNLAILDVDAAAGVQERFPEVDSWMIAGHSLGGTAASEYAARHEDDFSDVVFLASYPMSDLSGFEGDVLSVVGSNDDVVNRVSYENARAKLPAGARELVITGGNHANFGNYGEQDGDGQPSVSREEQQAETADAIAQLAAA